MGVLKIGTIDVLIENATHYLVIWGFLKKKNINFRSGLFCICVISFLWFSYIRSHEHLHLHYTENSVRSDEFVLGQSFVI